MTGKSNFFFISLVNYGIIFLESVRRMEEKKHAVFMGTSSFAKTILEGLIDIVDVVLVVSQPDSLVGRKRVLTKSPVKAYAEECGIEVYTPQNIKVDYQKILDKDPDIIITCAYGQILPLVLLENPVFGAINVHASLLPKLRGGAPIHRAIIEGQTETGITIMYMDAGMDTGDIIAKDKTEILFDDTLDTLSLRLAKMGCILLKETLPKIFNHTNVRLKQSVEDATYAHIITKEDEHIDFSKGSLEIYNLIRGLNSNPGAFTILNGEVLKVYEARIGNAKGRTSCINNIYKDGIGVGTRDGEIILTKIKPSGKNTISVRDYLNGQKKDLIGVILE